MLVEIVKRINVVINKNIKWLDVGDKIVLCDDDAKSLIRGGEAKACEEVVTHELKTKKEESNKRGIFKTNKQAKINTEKKAVFGSPDNK